MSLLQPPLEMCIRSLRFEHFSPWDKVCGCVSLRNYRQHILRDRRMFKVFFYRVSRVLEQPVWSRSNTSTRCSAYQLWGSETTVHECNCAIRKRSLSGKRFSAFVALSPRFSTAFDTQSEKKKISITILRWLNWVICLKGFWVIHTTYVDWDFLFFSAAASNRDLRYVVFFFSLDVSAHKSPLKRFSPQLSGSLCEVSPVEFFFTFVFFRVLSRVFSFSYPPLKSSVATHKS